MNRSRYIRHVRSGFTLVELMVATALVVLILTILATAFAAATESLSRLRSMGNMATDLRTAQDKLRSDLESQHFETGDSPGILRLSDLKYHQLTNGRTESVPPLSGYFRIEHGAAANSGSIYESADAESMTSTKAVNHALEFTVKRQGQSPDDLFVADVPSLTTFSVSDAPTIPNQFVSRWARVRWELRAVPGGAGGVQTYTLHRCVRLLVEPKSGVAIPAITQTESDLVSAVLNAGTYNPQTLASVTDPLTRPAIAPYSQTLNPTHYGDDIVLSNVTSFEIKPTWDARGTTDYPRAPRSQWPNTGVDAHIVTTAGTALTNGDYPFDDLPQVADNTTLAGTQSHVFDTWSSSLTGWNTSGSANSIPLRIRVTALQVKIRVFDPKNLLSRQISFIVQP